MNPEILDCLVFGTRSIVLVQHKGVGDGRVQQKVKNVLVEFSTFCAATVVASKLITSIYSSHILVVGHDGLRARNRDL